MVVYYTLQAIMFVGVALSSNAYVSGGWFWAARCVLWILYYLRSKRVKNTFVK